MIKNLVATVSGEPLMFPASGLLDKNSWTSPNKANCSAGVFSSLPNPVSQKVSPSALTVPGLLANPTLEKSTV